MSDVAAIPNLASSSPAEGGLCSDLLQRATFWLALSRPEFSACTVITPAQRSVIRALALLSVCAFLLWPYGVTNVIVVIMSLGFLVSLVTRTTLAILGRMRPPQVPVTDPRELPVYSVLVPVYREAAILPQLWRSLSTLDYPPDKLDIKLVMEEDDDETRHVAAELGFQSVVVPPGLPRTKPKACNFALQLARGEFVVVYDAEDRPEPDQLRKAVQAFRDRPEISCFQARLTVDHAKTWIARMFALDYAIWFNTLLPGLGWLRAPIPLGGTSNHFRKAVLLEVGAWDPFNVTEDADLGVRLARSRYRVAILDSSTYEEGPDHFDPWLRQRTRWMKGYMQTLLVHTRHPRMLVANLGLPGCFLLQAFLGGAVWSALVNPLLWILFMYGALADSAAPNVLETIARISGITLLAANGILAGLSSLGARDRACGVSFVAMLSYPIFWFLISVATYRALWQLLRDPFRWEKTPHGPSVA